MGPLTNITHYIPHIIQLKFSTNNTHRITTKIGPQNYIIPTQSPTSFSLWAKPKESPNSLKFHYDVALFTKPATMRYYLQSPLLHGTSKTRCYTAILYKISKSFYKAQMLIWHYFHKAQILIWHYFTKPKY